MLFDNFTIRECSIENQVETNQINLSDYVQNPDNNSQSDVATGFAIDKELEIMAVSTQTGVHIFEFQESYKEIAKIYISNVI